MSNIGKHFWGEENTSKQSLFESVFFERIANKIWAEQEENQPENVH